jgi:heme oxygenase
LEAFGEMKMKENYAILKNNVLIKKDVILQDLAVIGKNGSKKAKHRCARAINPEPMKKKGI